MKLDFNSVHVLKAVKNSMLQKTLFSFVEFCWTPVAILIKLIFRVYYCFGVDFDTVNYSESKLSFIEKWDYWVIF